MAVTKLKNEKKLITFFIISSAIVFVTSAIFLLVSINKDELGGSFITAMLLFISGYGLIVFIARALKYKFITKLQDAIIKGGERDLSVLAEKFSKSLSTIEEKVTFLIDNGYLPGFSISGQILINEEEKSQILKKEFYQNQIIETKNKEEKKVLRKKIIESEKCPNCGAKVKFNEGSADCPYCGNSLKKL